MRDLETIKRQNREAVEGKQPERAEVVVYLPKVVENVARGFSNIKPAVEHPISLNMWETCVAVTCAELRTALTFENVTFYRACGMNL
jgi:hypothetical protein